MINDPVDFDLETVRALGALVHKHSLIELTLESERTKYRLVCEPQTAAAKPHEFEVTIESPTVESTEIEVDDISCLSIESPAVGVFYRSSSPDIPPFVQVGDYVEKGQTIGLIEAMKTFNEIPTPYSGRVLSLVVDSGQLVNVGDTLLTLSIGDEANEE